MTTRAQRIRQFQERLREEKLDVFKFIAMTVPEVAVSLRGVSREFRTPAWESMRLRDPETSTRMFTTLDEDAILAYLRRIDVHDADSIPYDPRQDNQAGLRACVAQNYARCVTYLLQNPRTDPSIENNLAIRWASKNGHLAIVQSLLRDVRVDPSAANNDAIRWAAFDGNTGIFQLLLRDARVDPSDVHNEALISASRYGHADIVELLLADPRVDPTDGNPIFGERNVVFEAADSGHAAVVQLLLADGRADPAARRNAAIIAAAANGHAAVVQLLLADVRVDPADRHSAALQSAKDLAIVQLLLADGRVNVAEDDNRAIRVAAIDGHAAVVDALIANGADPSARNNEAIRRSMDVAVVRRLLEDPRVDASAGDNVAIRSAAESGQVEIVRMLVVAAQGNPAIDPSSQNNYALREAAKEGSVKIVRILLSDARVDPSVDGNTILRIVERMAHRFETHGGNETAYYQEIMEILLAHPRVLATRYDDNRLVIKLARRRGIIIQ